MAMQAMVSRGRVGETGACESESKRGGLCVGWVYVNAVKVDF